MFSESIMTMPMLRRLLLFGVVLFLVAGCVTPPPPRPTKQVEQPRVDVKAQQVYYDQGLKYYSQEDYRAAQEAFQKVVENGPTTRLGLKAQENLKKLQQILKTIDTIQSK
jgi:Tfp pilus assembly protein PilF